MTTMSVDPTNLEQARAWDGGEGECWATHHEQLDAALAHYQPAFEAACGGVWLHGRAAEAAGPQMIADDLAAAIPQVL